MGGNFIWECANKKCKVRTLGWASTKHGGVVKEGGDHSHADRNGNIHLCPECKKKLDRYYTTCDCGLSTTGGMSSCAHCYYK